MSTETGYFQGRGTLTVRHTLEGRRRNVLHIPASLLDAQPAHSAQQGSLLADAVQSGPIQGVDSSLPAPGSAHEIRPEDDAAGDNGQIGRIPDEDDGIPF